MKKPELLSIATALPATCTGDVIALAFVLDKSNKMERVIVGTEWNVRTYLEGNEDTEVLFDLKQPLDL